MYKVESLDQLRSPYFNNPDEASYLAQAVTLFPEETLDAACQAGRNILQVLDDESGIFPASYKPDLLIWDDQSQYFPPAISFALARLGINPEDLIEASSVPVGLPVLEDADVLVITSDDSDRLIGDDSIGLVLASAGSRTTFVKGGEERWPGSFPQEALSRTLGDRVKTNFTFRDEPEVSHEVLKSGEFDLIQLGSMATLAMLVPEELTSSGSTGSEQQVSDLQVLASRLKAGGTIILTDAASTNLVNVFKNLGRERSEAVIDGWSRSGIDIMIRPCYQLYSSVIETLPPPKVEVPRFILPIVTLEKQ